MWTGNDYSNGPYNVTFPAGKTSATFDVQLYDDNVFEKNETFKLIIDQRSFSSVEQLVVNPLWLLLLWMMMMVSTVITKLTCLICKPLIAAPSGAKF